MDKLETLIKQATKILSSKCNKYSYTKENSLELTHTIQAALNSDFSSAINIIKNTQFFVLKHLWPYLNSELLEQIFNELPLLKSLYLSQKKPNGKPGVKLIISQTEIRKAIFKKNYQISRLEKEALLYYIKRVNSKTAMTVFDQFIESPNLICDFLSITKDGFGKTTPVEEFFSITTATFIKKLNPDLLYYSKNFADPAKKQLLEQLHNTLSNAHNILFSDFDLAHIISPNSNYKFVKFLGRTLLFSTNNDKILAIKISKNKEDDYELFREYNIVKFLQENQENFKLKSTLPKPLQLSQIKAKIIQKLFNKNYPGELDFNNLIGYQELYTAYIYEASTEYFEYVSNIKNDQEFAQSIINSMNDLMIMFDYGIIFHQLVPLFHSPPEDGNREDGGKFMVLANVLKNISARKLNMKAWDLGTGRLPAFKKTLKFPNLRLSGVADLGDCVSVSDIKEIAGDCWYDAVKVGLGRVENGWKDSAEIALTSNSLAEYVFVVGLLAGIRILEIKKDKNVDNWISSAHLIVKVVKKAIIDTTNVEQEKIDQFFKVNINADILARQMQFFMTNEYAYYVDENLPFPTELYHPNTKFEVNYQGIQSHPYWIKGQGFARDPSQGFDLGATECQLPLTELIKLAHLLPLFIFWDRQNEVHNYDEDICAQAKAFYNQFQTRIVKPNSDRMEKCKKNIKQGFDILQISENELQENYELILQNDDHVIKLLNDAPNIQLELILRNKVVQQALINITNKQIISYDKGLEKRKIKKCQTICTLLKKISVEKRGRISEVILNIIDEPGILDEIIIEQVLAPDDILNILRNPIFKNQITSMILNNASILFELFLNNTQELPIYDLSIIQNSLLKIKFDQMDLYCTLKNLQKSKRLGFLKYCNVKFNDFLPPYFLAQSLKFIPTTERFKALKILGLKKIFNYIAKLGNQGAFLEHMVKLLTQKDQTQLVKSSECIKIFETIESHYKQQIFALLS